MKEHGNKKSYKGSLTVEAALTLPMFIFAIVIFLYCIQVIQLYEQIQKGITDVARRASTYDYVFEQFRQDDNEEGRENEEEQKGSKVVLSSLLDGTFYKINFLEVISEDEINENLIVGGKLGILFLGSKFMENETIEVKASYSISLPTLFFKVHPIVVQQGVKTRGFVGRPLFVEEEETEEKGEYVYITEKGTVYHVQMTCSYIYRKPQAVIGSNIEEKRNNSGGKYYPCATCVHSGLVNTQTYYITGYGSRYHSSASCTQVERNIKKILLSEVGERRACKKCGGEK